VRGARAAQRFAGVPARAPGSYAAPTVDERGASGGPARPFAGLEVVVAGRLATLSRAEAFERVLAAGGRWAEGPGPGTALLVVGGAEAPLGEDGELARPLAEARARIEAGQGLSIVGEDEFLERLGLSAAHEAQLRRLYTSSQLARILDVPARRLRSWVRAGLLRPARTVRRLAYFEFRQLAAARTLARLTAAGLSARRVRASLEELGRWWPEAAATLGPLAASEEDGALVVRTPGGELAEPSGQLRLDFADEESAPTAPARVDGELWFQRALRLEEEERLEEAAQAYARALDPEHPRAEVAFNLGNALYVLERQAEAVDAFTLATTVEPEYVEAWNNLGNALSGLGRHEDARAAFERALAIEPGYADAHFNLGETLAALGELEPARAHWRAYLEVDPDSRWAAEVRARLRRTDPRGISGRISSGLPNK